MEAKKSNKKSIAVFVGLIVLILDWLLIQYYGYSCVNVPEKDYADIQREYHLVLQDDNWEYQLYNKNTIVHSKPSFYCFKNYYINIFDDKYITVSIKVTDGDEIFDLALPAFINGRYEPQIMIQENVNYKNLNIQVQLIKTCELPELEDGYYVPNCKFILNTMKTYIM